MKVLFFILSLLVLAPVMLFSLRNQAPPFITEYDLFSPIFNAGKSYSSLYIPHSWEWSAEHMGLNLFVPLDRKYFDVAFSLCSEDMSIGSKLALLQLTLGKKICIGS